MQRMMWKQIKVAHFISKKLAHKKEKSIAKNNAAYGPPPKKACREGNE